MVSSGLEITTPSASWLRLNWLPQPRRAAMAARMADSLYIAGGMDVNGRVVKSISRLHMTSGVWSHETPPMPTPRYGATSNVMRSGLWIVCGGLNNYDLTLNTVEAFDCVTGTWETLPPMQEARVHATSAVFGGRLYVFGTTDNMHWLCIQWISSCMSYYYLTEIGGLNRGGKALSSVECYNPEHQRWALCMPMSTPRYGASACVINHEGIVVTGGASQLTVPSPTLDTVGKVV